MTTASARKAAPDPAAVVDHLDAFTLQYQRWAERGVRATGTSTPRLRLLLALNCAEPPTMRQLADGLGVTPRNVTGLVDALESDGLLRRVDRPGDRRVTLVELTDAGRALLAGIRERHHAAARDLLTGLDPADLAVAARVLGELTARLGAAPASR